MIGKATDNEELARAGGHMLEVVVDSANPHGGAYGEVKDSGIGDMVRYKTTRK
jgi:hypothetical protein